MIDPTVLTNNAEFVINLTLTQTNAADFWDNLKLLGNPAPLTNAAQIALDLSHSNSVAANDGLRLELIGNYNASTVFYNRITDLGNKLIFYHGLDFWSKIIGIIIACFALLASWLSHSQKVTFDMIKDLYALFSTINNGILKDWQMRHLLVLDQTEYYKTVENIRALLVKKQDQDQMKQAQDQMTEYALKETMYILTILMIFDQLYLQYLQTNKWLHNFRRKFLEAMLNYCMIRVFRNPRIYYFLDGEINQYNQSKVSGTSFENKWHLEANTFEYLAETMPKKIKDLERIAPDEFGPFKTPSSPNT